MLIVVTCWYSVRYDNNSCYVNRYSAYIYGGM